MPMKAPITQAAAEAASAPGFSFLLLLGPRHIKMNFKKMDSAGSRFCHP